MSTEAVTPSLDTVSDRLQNQSSQEPQEQNEEDCSDLQASTSAAAVTTSASTSSSTPTLAASQDSTSASQSSQRPGVPSLKRKYTDLMEDLVSKAKASKNEDGKRIVVKDEGADEDDERFGKKLATELTCAICSEIFINPVTCLDCLHVFCGNCLMAWTENDNSTCPSCRKRIRSTRDSFHLKPIIELLFEANPSMKRDDYDEELKAGPYKPGKAIKIPDSYDESDEEEYQSEDDEEADPPYQWEPCPCCPPNNSNAEYTCANPIQLDGDGNPIRNFSLTFQGHKRCAWCDKAVPSDDSSDALKKTQCAGCQKVYCDALFGSCPGAPNDDLLVKVEDSTIYFPNHFRNHMPPLQFQVNAFEEERFKDWVNSGSTNLTFEELGIKMRDWLMNKNNSQLPIGWNMASGDSYACKYCLAEAYSSNLREYLIEKREELGYTDTRVKCWYGYTCRTQRHNNDHCERIQHLCNEIPPNERRNNAPARSPTVTTGSARNIPRIVPQINQGTPSPPASPRASAAAAVNAGSPRQVSGADDADGGRNSD